MQKLTPKAYRKIFLSAYTGMLVAMVVVVCGFEAITGHAQQAGDRIKDRCFNGVRWDWCADSKQGISTPKAASELPAELDSSVEQVMIFNQCAFPSEASAIVAKLVNQWFQAHPKITVLDRKLDTAPCSEPRDQKISVTVAIHYTQESQSK